MLADSPVELTVSEIRQALWRESRGAEARAAGETPTGFGPLAGRLFHQAAATLLGDAGWRAEPETGRRIEGAWERGLGPLLTAQIGSLGQSGAEALAAWQALKSFAAWWEPQAAAGRVLVEQPLSRVIEQPQWRAPVRITGVADALLAPEGAGRRCVLEFKVAESLQELDLLQAALYRLLLSQQAEESYDIALVCFGPEVREIVLRGEQLKETEARLLGVIARLAGLTPVPPPREGPETLALGEEILRTLTSLGQPVTQGAPPVAGPTFLRFFLQPGHRVRVRRLPAYADDLGVRLGIPPPMIGVEDGKLVVDVARPDRETVPFARVRSALGRGQNPAQAIVPLGVDLSNQLRVLDLATPDSPHVLVAGTAGSGKSEWLRTAVAALILTHTPETLRLVLIDPKRNAFCELADSRFLLNREALVYPPEDSALDHLDILIAEMEHRYDLFAHAGADTLGAYREKTGKLLHRVVCVVDEFGDLMLSARDRRALETRIVRLGAKARAAGIHLILATQHPDAKTVTTALQANLSVRLCFKTTTAHQSQVALKQSGAERLLGRGDFFFSRGSELWRLQAPLLSEDERRAIYQGAY